MIRLTQTSRLMATAALGALLLGMGPAAAAAQDKAPGPAAGAA